MKAIFCISLLLVLSCSNTGRVPDRAPSTLPTDKEEHALLPESIGDTGWLRVSEVSRFVGDSLFEYINGAAEMYHKYDFVDLQASEYHKGESVITADLYRFPNVDRAFGMYTTLRPDEPDTVSLGAEGFAFGANLVFVKGPYMANVYTYEDSKEMIAAVRMTASMIEAGLPGSRNKPEMFSLFPVDGRVEFSEKVYAESFLGQGFLSDVYTVNYSRAGSDFTLFISGDPGSSKLEEWRQAIQEEPDPDTGYQHLPYDGSRYLHAVDSYHGEIIAGPQAGRLVGMVGYSPQDLEVLVAWLHSLLEER
jgi:hypothetical protein